MKTNLIVGKKETGIIVDVEDKNDAFVSVYGYGERYIFNNLGFNSVLFETEEDFEFFTDILYSLGIDFDKCYWEPKINTEYKLVFDRLSGTCIMFKLQPKENNE